MLKKNCVLVKILSIGGLRKRTKRKLCQMSLIRVKVIGFRARETTENFLI